MTALSVHISWLQHGNSNISSLSQSSEVQVLLYASWGCYW